MVPKALTNAVVWLYQINKTEGYHPNIEKLAALFVVMPAYNLVIYGNMCLETNKLKVHPIGMATLKKSIKLLKST